MKSLYLASKVQSNLFTDLQWVVNIIKSYLLHFYEIKEKTDVAEISKNHHDFKQFVDFVSEYNEQVIEMNKKIISSQMNYYKSILLNWWKVK